MISPYLLPFLVKRCWRGQILWQSCGFFVVDENVKNQGQQESRQW
jgi:hypothetical protein